MMFKSVDEVQPDGSMKMVDIFEPLDGTPLRGDANIGPMILKAAGYDVPEEFLTNECMNLVGLVFKFLPGAKVISIKGVDVTIESGASPKQLFDAEAQLRKETGVLYELFLERQADDSKLRLKLAAMRGVGGAT